MVVVVEELLELPALLDLEEVLVVVFVRQVIESQVTWQVFTEEEFFSGADLVEELGEDFVVRKLLGGLVVLHREVLVSAVGDFLDDAGLVDLEYFDGLLAVVDVPDPPVLELLFQGGLLLLDVGVGELDGGVIGGGAVDLVPDEAKDVFGVAVDVFEHLAEAFLRFQAFLAALVYDVC